MGCGSSSIITKNPIEVLCHLLDLLKTETNSKVQIKIIEKLIEKLIFNENETFLDILPKCKNKELSELNEVSLEEFTFVLIFENNKKSIMNFKDLMKYRPYDEKFMKTPLILKEVFLINIQMSTQREELEKLLKKEKNFVGKSVIIQLQLEGTITTVEDRESVLTSRDRGNGLNKNDGDVKEIEEGEQNDYDDDIEDEQDVENNEKNDNENENKKKESN